MLIDTTKIIEGQQSFKISLKIVKKLDCESKLLKSIKKILFKSDQRSKILH